MVEIESRMLVAKDWREGTMGSYWLMGTQPQFCKMKKVLETDGDDSCMTFIDFLYHMSGRDHVGKISYNYKKRMYSRNM